MKGTDIEVLSLVYICAFGRLWIRWTLVMFPPHIKKSLHFGKLDIRVEMGSVMLNSIIYLDMVYMENSLGLSILQNSRFSQSKSPCLSIVFVKMALSYFTGIWYSGDNWQMIYSMFNFFSVNLDVQHDFLMHYFPCSGNFNNQFFWDHVQFAVKMSTDCSEILALAKVIQILYLEGIFTIGFIEQVVEIAAAIIHEDKVCVPYNLEKSLEVNCYKNNLYLEDFSDFFILTLSFLLAASLLLL
ncbi:hypothetical protein ACJX0J_022717, partial [Zea mays]